MTILYRILGFIINSVALLFTISIVFSIPMFFSSPVTMLSAFLIIGTILYAFYSYKFQRQVLQQQQVVPKSLKDWVKVNGIVAMIFSLQIIIGVFVLLNNPAVLTEAMSKVGAEVSAGKMKGFFYAMLVYGVILLTHILWTFALMKKHESYFEE